MGSKIEDVEKCGRVAEKVKKTLAKYTHVEILFVNASPPSGILLNGEEIVSCDEEEETIDYIISKIASFSSNKLIKGVVMAAAVFKNV
ncbi:MAG: hypothetical protein QXT53_01065 [Ignisphaera sp.]